MSYEHRLGAKPSLRSPVPRQDNAPRRRPSTMDLHPGKKLQEVTPPTGGMIKNYRMSYWVLMNLAFFVSCVIAVSDRFTANSISGGLLGQEAFNARRDNCIAENGGEDSVECQPYVLYFQIIIKTTARILVVSFCFFFFTMCRATNNWLLEMVDRSPFLSRFFDLSDAASAIYIGHKYLGFIFMGVLIVHLSSVFVPLAELDFNLDNADPVWFILSPIERHIPFTGIEGKWTIRTDDFIQLAFGTLIVLFVQPLTIVWRKYRKRYFNFTQGLHIGGAVGVIWLFYRVPEHLRVFAINTPFLVLYAFDRIIHTWYYRGKIFDRESEYYTLHLDEDYVVNFFPLLRKSESHFVPSNIGDVYYLSHSDMKREPFKHPFTHFRYRPTKGEDINRFSTVNITPVVEEDYDGLDDDDQEHAVGITEGRRGGEKGTVELRGLEKIKKIKSWTQGHKDKKREMLGTVAQIHREGKDKHMGCWGAKRSFTETLRDDNTPGWVSVLGPYRRVYRRLMRPNQPCPYIVIGSGSGCSLLLDFVYWVREKHESTDENDRLRYPVHIVFTTSSRALLLFVSDVLFKVASQVPLLTCALHLTSKDFENTGTAVLETDKALGTSIDPNRVLYGSKGNVMGYMVSNRHLNPAAVEEEKRDVEAADEDFEDDSSKDLPAKGLRWAGITRARSKHGLGASASQVFIYAPEKLDIPAQAGLTTINTSNAQETAAYQSTLEVGRFELNDVLMESDPSTEIYFCGSIALYGIFKNKCNKANRAFYSDTPYL